MEDESKEQKKEQKMRPWQHGWELSDLKTLEHFYAPHNSHALSVFGKFKKNNIAEALHQGTLRLFEESGSGPAAAMVVERAKVSSNINMFPGVAIGKKLKGDVTFSRLVGDTTILFNHLQLFTIDNCWLITFAGDRQIRSLAETAGFQYVGYKVNSFSEIFSVYFRNSQFNLEPIQHPTIPPADLVGMAKISTWDTSNVRFILDTIRVICPQFTNHYSNYNQNNAWGAISLRGYSADPTCILKPAEMNKAWHETHRHDTYYLQDTPLYQYFDEVRDLLSFLDGDIHRVRFMRLAPGGGELLRHTDQVDPDAGNSIGKLARLHFPLKTNDKVVFSTWDENDTRQEYHYGFGECWVIDTRKPHMAVNGGDQERIHLVVDTIVTPKLERMICDSIRT
jgi:hypothetical protein